MPDILQASSNQPVALPNDPALAAQAATKKYVDDHTSIKINRAGDTMEGDLLLPGVPTNPQGAIPKSYVDGLDARRAIDIPCDPTEPPDGTGNISSTNVQAALEELDTEKIAKSGDEMTGALLVPPTVPEDSDPINLVTPKFYVDRQGSKEFFINFQTEVVFGTTSPDLVHNLGRRPKVAIYSSTGEEVYSNIEYSTISKSGIRIRFKTPFTGTILLT